MERPLSHVTLAGVFVGGSSSRMGGSPKGLLEAPEGGTLVDRWRAILTECGLHVVLVGRHPAYANYASRGLEVLDDEPPGIGPLGGLVALLRRAGTGAALAVACDMPFVSPGMIGRLLAAPPAPVVAPRRDGFWEPLCARYEAPAVLPHALRRVVAGRLSLQGLLDEAGAATLPLGADAASELRDWDTPEDRDAQ